jgi:hypothetical protein
MLRISLKRTADLTPAEGRAIAGVIAEAFDVLTDPARVYEHYRAAIPEVALAHHGGELVGLHFYQSVRVGPVPVFRFSLAAKSPRYPGKGLHRVMSRILLMRSAWRINPLRPVALAGVCNNPRTYRNALSVGGVGFPDVRDPSRPFPYHRLYRRVAERLGIPGLDLRTGLIEKRGESLGLRLKPDTVAPSDDPLFRGFVDYIGGDPDRGVFTMVVVRPVALAVTAALRRARVLLV